MKVPFLDLKLMDEPIKQEINKEINEVIDSSRFIMGPKVEKFERKLAKYVGTKYAVSLASGTDALLFSLIASGIKNDDEVIVTPYTMFASASCISIVGAKTIFVDVDPRTFNIDVNKIEERITDKTKAIIPVHLFGQASNMTKIMEIANKYNLVVVEDACQAIGAVHDNKNVGSFGIGCFSFFPTKNLGCYGDGGAITTDSEEIASKIKTLRKHGATKKYIHSIFGYNSRLDAIQAGILNVKIKKINAWNKMRKSNAMKYNSLLGEQVVKPFEDENNKHVYHQYTILTEKRDELQKFLKFKGIDTMIYYPLPLHLNECYNGLNYKQGDLPISESLPGKVLSLPIHPYLTNEQIEFVANSLVEFFTE